MPKKKTRREALIAQAKAATGGRKHYLPAEWAIRQFGSAYALAKATGLCHSSVWRWLQAPDDRGRGAAGYVPGRSQLVVLKAAQERGLDITAQDLIEGRRA